MNDDGITRSIKLSSSLHFSSLAEFQAAGNGKPVLPGQTTIGVDNGYGLQGNPTQHGLQDEISNLENGKYSILYPSGLTALVALGSLLKSGDHWLLPDGVYFPMRRYAEYIKQNFAINCDYYDANSIESIKALINDKTKIIHIETPASVTFDMIDVNEVVKIAKSKDIITTADNTWASGVLYKPLDHGVDISLLSLTKYPAGYSDVFMGSITTKDSKLFDQLKYNHRVLGYTVSPFSSMLVSRGLESLSVRLAAHAKSANQLIGAIKDHKKSTTVYQATMDNETQTKTNGLFSIGLDREYSDAELEIAISKLKTFSIGESWGGTRSLVLPFQPEDLKSRLSPPDHTIIRFHAGLENIELLKQDITNFFEALP